MSSVNYELNDAVATVTLTRPQSLNALTDELMLELTDAFGRVAEDRDVRVVVLTGEGRGFCAGAHLGTIDRGDVGDAMGDAMAEIYNPTMRAIADCPVPTVAKINGVAAGGGFGLALSCDISIAARSAFFVSTFGPRLGIVPDLGTSWHLPNRAGAARARGIAMLGDRITADQAAEWGLIWSAVDDDQLDAEVTAVADRLKRCSPDAMARTRSAIADAENNTLFEQLDVEHRHQSVLIPANMLEGAAAFMGKREPNFSPKRTQEI
jgi:2-(1,2-epoxy-1,2-dihydrophenyl)acetyl-CoA isomerase